MKTLYKSKEGKKAIWSLYDQKLESLNLNVSHKKVKTSYGQTHVLVTGNQNKPPIVLIHGVNACAPIALETYKGLVDHFLVYAVDIPAQPNKSDSIRIPLGDDSYGKWMYEVFDELSLEEVYMAGFSFGGLVILKTLEYDESKVKEVFLASPAYIVNGNPLKAITKVFIPMLRYMRSGKMKFVERFLDEVFTEKDPFAIAFLSQVFKSFNMDMRMMPEISKRKAYQIKTPITLFAAKKDIIFPGEKMIKRALKIFPSLKAHYLLEDSKHVQSTEDNQRIDSIIIKSLNDWMKVPE